jgi:hypothetical protein
MKLGISSRLRLALRPVQIDKNDSATFLTKPVNYSSTEAISTPLEIGLSVMRDKGGGLSNLSQSLRWKLKP